MKVKTVYLFIPVQSYCNNLETFICSIWIHFIQTLPVCQWVKYAVPGNIIMKLRYWVHIQSYRFTLSLAICSESWHTSCLTRITFLYSKNKELQICRQQTVVYIQITKSPCCYQIEFGTSQTLITLIPHWNKLSSFLGGFMMWGWTAFTRIVFTCKTNKIFLLIFL